MIKTTLSGRGWTPKPTDGSEVLYVPLWHPTLAGATFQSKDRTGFLCSVNGALWTSKGRLFDGNDDYIEYVGADWRIADTRGEILAWFKTTGVGSHVIFGSADVGLATQFLTMFVGSTYLVAYSAGEGAADQIRGGTVVNDGVWRLGSIASNGSAYFIFLNGVAETLTVIAGANTGDWLDGVPNRDNFTIGALHRSDGYVLDYTGTIGEVWYYNRVLSAAERMRIYQNTQWRYQ